MAPIALATYVVAVRSNGCRAPSLVLCQVGLVPRAGPVDHTVELEGKDTWQVGRGAADGGAHLGFLLWWCCRYCKNQKQTKLAAEPTFVNATCRFRPLSKRKCF